MMRGLFCDSQLFNIFVLFLVFREKCVFNFLNLIKYFNLEQMRCSQPYHEYVKIDIVDVFLYKALLDKAVALIYQVG